MSVIRDPQTDNIRAQFLELNEQCREKLRRAEGIACYALSHQPDNAALQDINQYLMKALTDIVDAITVKMTIPPVVSDAVNPPAESEESAENMAVEPTEKPLDPNAPEMVRGKKKAIGNFAGAGNVVSYAIDEMYAITVTANTTGDGAWMFKGIKNGETEIMGTILGGKWKAMQYCKFIRNGIVSRANRLYHGHHKSKKAAAALADARSDAAGAVDNGTEAAQ